MKHKNITLTLNAVTIAVAIAAGATAVAGQPLGQILATNTVNLKSGGAVISVTDTIHPLFSGDVVTTTQDASTVMRFTGDSGVVYTGSDSVTAFEKSDDAFVIDSTKGGLRFMFRSGVAYRILTECYVVEPAANQTVANGEWIGGSVETADGVQSVLSAQGELSVSLRQADDNITKVSENGETSINTSVCQQVAGTTVATAGAGVGISALVGGGATVGVAALAASDSSSSTTTVPVTDTTAPSGGGSNGATPSGSGSTPQPTSPTSGGGSSSSSTSGGGSSAITSGGTSSSTPTATDVRPVTTTTPITNPDDPIVLGDASSLTTTTSPPVDPKDTKDPTPPVDPKDPPASPVQPKNP